MSTENSNYITEYYKSHNQITEFLIANAYYALNCARSKIIFEPVPDNWSVIENKVNKSVNEVIKTIKDAYNDEEIIEKLNENTYTFIKFILESNKMLFKLQYFANTHNCKYSNLEDIILLNVIHTELIEDKLKGKTTRYLYHGSPYENWYSIMRNGLKIGSKNKYFINGSAYGEGIYLSDNFNTSLQYCNLNKNQIIISIFEVIDKPEWKKTANIFVVNDENSLLLRYLLVIDDIKNSKNDLIFKSIENFLNDLKKKEIENKVIETKNIVTIHNKRLMKEYQMILKNSSDKLGFSVKLQNEDNLGKWIIYITKTDNDKLDEQMKRLNIKAIEIEITFKPNYPIEPPFIRIVYPHFKFRSGHITTGGSLCMEMLTNQGWSPAFNIESVITQIKLAINEGDGEIDEINYSQKYTFDEAVSSFKRVLSTHGWI
jgi:ubiquitin-protein ligase